MRSSRSESDRSPSRALVPAVLVFGLILAAASAGGQEIDELMRGFAPNGDFQIEIDGTVVEGAEILLAERPQAYLIIARDLGGPLLLELRRGTFSRVHMMKLLRRDEGTIDMVADAAPRTLGRYQLDGRAVGFTVDGKSVKMVEKPPLLGLHDLDDVTAHSPHYEQSAAAYEPDTAAIEALRGVVGSHVRVRVYFGSWCPHCKRHVPFMVRVENELGEAGGIAFEYFGLPKPKSGAAPWPDGVKKVPTAIVYVDGKEVGRVIDSQWRAPEIALRQLVSGSPAAGR